MTGSSSQLSLASLPSCQHLPSDASLAPPPSGLLLPLPPLPAPADPHHPGHHHPEAHPGHHHHPPQASPGHITHASAAPIIRQTHSWMSTNCYH